MGEVGAARAVMAAHPGQTPPATPHPVTGASCPLYCAWIPGFAPCLSRVGGRKGHLVAL